MEAYFRAAMANVYMHGDTDIFPFPLENRILFDQIESVIPLLLSARDKFESTFSQDAPHDIKELVPVGHTGFRNAT
jgi:hypothetical protein